MHEFLVAFLVPKKLSVKEAISVISPTLPDYLIDHNQTDIDVTTVANTLRDRYLSCGWYDFDRDICAHDMRAKTLIDPDAFWRRLGFTSRNSHAFVHENPKAITDCWLEKPFLTDASDLIDDFDMLVHIPDASPNGLAHPWALDIGAYVNPAGSVTLSCKRRHESIPSLITERLHDYISSREAIVLEHGIEAEDALARKHMYEALLTDCSSHGDAAMLCLSANAAL